MKTPVGNVGLGDRPAKLLDAYKDADLVDDPDGDFVQFTKGGTSMSFFSSHNRISQILFLDRYCSTH